MFGFCFECGCRISWEDCPCKNYHEVFRTQEYFKIQEDLNNDWKNLNRDWQILENDFNAIGKDMDEAIKKTLAKMNIKKQD